MDFTIGPCCERRDARTRCTFEHASHSLILITDDLHYKGIFKDDLDYIENYDPVELPLLSESEITALHELKSLTTATQLANFRFKASPQLKPSLHCIG